MTINRLLLKPTAVNLQIILTLILFEVFGVLRRMTSYNIEMWFTILRLVKATKHVLDIYIIYPFGSKS